MNEIILVNSPATANGCLPEIARTPNGAQFDPRSDKWVYRDSVVNINLDFTSFQASENLVFSVKRVLVWYAENKSSSHLENMFERLEHFFRNVTNNKAGVLTIITTNDLINYKALLTYKNDWYLGALSGLLKKWHQLSIPGVTDDAVAFLKQLRIKGNQKGEAVLTMDPEHGPFTDIETQSMQVALDSGYADGAISLADYVLVWLFMALGQRSIQYTALKICDVGVSNLSAGDSVYTLRLPRAKQRGQLSRGKFSNRVLIPQIGEKLVQHVDDVRYKFRNILEDPEQAPLFPAKQSRKNEPKGFEYHRTAQSLADTLERSINSLSVVSERTGKQLHITSTRFRRTVGTRAAMEGHGELVIAELLDHTDTQNVGVYVQAVPEIIERIDRAVAMHLAPLAQAFAGVIITDESRATRGGDPASRVCDPRINPSMKPIGNCGKHGFCGSLSPIACYTCRSFQPWLDAPHAAVLDYLIAERERLMVDCDSRIASINDRTILAVAEVVRRCAEMRCDTEEGCHG